MLPDVYNEAVGHCFRAKVSGVTRFLEWEDTKLRRVIRGKICKQWVGEVVACMTAKKDEYEKVVHFTLPSFA